MAMKDTVQKYLASTLGPLVQDGFPLVVCVMVPDENKETTTAVILTNVFRLQASESQVEELRSELSKAVSEALAGGIHPNATVSDGHVLKTDGSN